MKKIISIILFVVLLKSMSIYSYAIDEQVAINELNFPDDNFRNYIVNNIDSNMDGVLSKGEIENTYDIHVEYMDIASLKGIEYFNNLSELWCYGNNIAYVDLSNNKMLGWLDCSNNNIMELDLTNNTQLWNLMCNNNKIEKLDLSNCDKLEYINCEYNNIKNLNINSDSNTLCDLDYSHNYIPYIQINEKCELSQLYSHDNICEIEVDSNGQFDLLEFFEGFDISKTENWRYCIVEDNTVTVDDDATYVSYDYNIGNGQIATAFLVVKGRVSENKGIEIDEQHFPSEKFMNYVINYIDID